MRASWKSSCAARSQAIAKHKEKGKQNNLEGMEGFSLRMQCSNTAKAVSDIPKIYSSHLLPQFKSFKECTDSPQALHYKTTPVLFMFALGTNSAGIAWTHAAQIQRIKRKGGISL